MTATRLWVDYSDPNLHVVEGPVYSFFASADPNPSSVSAPDWATWPNTATPIEATVVDVGTNDVEVTFACVDPNVVFDPNPVVIPGGGGVAVTSALVDADTPNLDITMTAVDIGGVPGGIGPAAKGTMTLHVHADGCATYRQDAGGIAEHPEDIVVDCKLNLADYAAIAEDWLATY